jgi:hypothetical protein
MAFLKDDILAGGVRYRCRTGSTRRATSTRSPSTAAPRTSGATRATTPTPAGTSSAQCSATAGAWKHGGRDHRPDRPQRDGGRHEPDGTFYFMDNDADPARNVRANQYNSAASNIIARGGNAEVLDGIIPTGRHDCLGIMTGAANPAIDAGDFTIWAGAFADHLTSWAGMFDNAAQTKMSRWVVKGASGFGRGGRGAVQLRREVPPGEPAHALRAGDVPGRGVLPQRAVHAVPDAALRRPADAALCEDPGSLGLRRAGRSGGRGSHADPDRQHAEPGRGHRRVRPVRRRQGRRLDRVQPGVQHRHDAVRRWLPRVPHRHLRQHAAAHRCERQP